MLCFGLPNFLRIEGKIGKVVMGAREIGIGTLALGELNRRTIKGNPHFRCE